MRRILAFPFLCLFVAALLGVPLSPGAAKLVIPGPTPTNSSVPQALRLLDQSAEAYGALEGLSMRVAYRLNADGETLSGQGTIAYEKSGRTRITRSGLAHPLIYPAASNDARVAKAALARNIQFGTGGASLALTALVQGNNPLRQPWVMVTGEKFIWGKKPHLLPQHGIAVLVTPPADSDLPPLEMMMYFDAKDNLLRRVEIQGRREGKKYFEAITFSQVRLNPPFPAETFVEPKRINWDPKLSVGSEPYALRGVSLEDYRGKVVLLEFWATWCASCVREVPWLLSSYQKHSGEGLVIIGISRDRNKKALTQFVQAHNLPWLQVFDTHYGQSSNAARYGVKTIPFALLIGKNGKIAAVGPRGAALEPALKKALAQ